MDARIVTVAAITCLLTSVGFVVGAAATGGINPRFVGNAGVGFGALAGGLLAGARLYRRMDLNDARVARLERIILRLSDDLGVHKRHDREALEEAAGLDQTGPHNVRRMRKS